MISIENTRVLFFFFFFQSEERESVSGNPEGKDTMLSPLQSLLAGQVFFQITRSAALFAAIVLLF